jgi:hypothetical protein
MGFAPTTVATIDRELRLVKTRLERAIRRFDVPGAFRAHAEFDPLLDRRLELTS